MSDILTQPRCGVCELHAASAERERYEISRNDLWVLRHHPDPAPLQGWLLLDSLRHLGGPIEFNHKESAAWGTAVQRASTLVQLLTGCQRVYAIAFGEGAKHLHLHLIPRFATEPASEAWKVADLYRAVAAGQLSATTPEAVQALVRQGRVLWDGFSEKDEPLAFGNPTANS